MECAEKFSTKSVCGIGLPLSDLEMVRTILGVAVTKRTLVGFMIPTVVLITGFGFLKNKTSGNLGVPLPLPRRTLSSVSNTNLSRVVALAEKKRSGPSDVLLATYMRSGSSFIGRMLGHRNDSFYWYEPLWKPDTWYYNREDGRMCHYTKPECKGAEVSATTLENNLGFLDDFYKCRIRPYTKRVLPNMHPKEKVVGPSWEVYRKSHKNATIAEKLAKLEPVCRRSTHRVTKVLRLDFSYTARLLQTNPSLKAILLLRDPRGVINSHIHTGWFPLKLKDENFDKKIKDDAGVLCSRMERDINAAKKLITEFKDRVKVIQYEDFKDPIKTIEQVYAFLGMDTSKTHADSTAKDSKKNRNLFSYRESMSWKTVQRIDTECHKVYRELGLVQYRDENHLRDLNQSGIVNELTYALEDHY